MSDAHKNFAYSTVAAAPADPANGTTGLYVTAGDGTRFPTPPYNAVICPASVQPLPSNAEIVRVTAMVGDQVTAMLRLQEGSSQRVIQAGDQFFAGPTAKTYTDIENYAGGALQSGVVTAGACAASGVAVTGGSGLITFTLAAANPLWVASAAGVLVPVNFGGLVAATLLPASLPAANAFWGYGIELDTSGTAYLVAAAAQSATAALALTAVNGPALATTAGRVRVLDVAISNVAGVYGLAASRDRRPWARGAYSRISRQANAAGGNDYTYALTTPAAIDATNLAMRVECSGLPLRIMMRAVVVMTTGHDVRVLPYIDGAAPEGMTGVAGAANSAWTQSITSGAYVALVMSYDYIPPAPGSRLIVPYWSVTGGTTVTLYADATSPAHFIIEELVRPNANNGAS